MPTSRKQENLKQCTFIFKRSRKRRTKSKVRRKDIIKIRVKTNEIETKKTKTNKKKNSRKVQ